MNNENNKKSELKLTFRDKLYLFRHKIDLKVIKAQDKLETKMDAAKKKLSEFSFRVDQKIDEIDHQLFYAGETIEEFQQKHASKIAAGYLAGGLLLGGIALTHQPKAVQPVQVPAAIEKNADDIVVNDMPPYVVREVADALELGIDERLRLAERYNIPRETMFLPMATVQFPKKIRLLTKEQHYKEEMQRRFDEPMNPEIMPEKLYFNYDFNPDDKAYPLPDKVSYYQINENKQPLPERGL